MIINVLLHFFESQCISGTGHIDLITPSLLIGVSYFRQNCQTIQTETVHHRNHINYHNWPMFTLTLADCSCISVCIWLASRSSVNDTLVRWTISSSLPSSAVLMTSVATPRVATMVTSMDDCCCIFELCWPAAANWPGTCASKTLAHFLTIHCSTSKL